MSLQPLAGRVMVEPLEAEKKIGSVLISDVLQESLHTGPVRGKVVAVGPEVYEIAEGDIVLYPKGGGTRVTGVIDNRVVLLEADVFAVEE